MVGFSIEYIYSVVFKAFLIDNLKVEFIEEFWSLYLSLIKILRGSEIYKVFIICINLHLIFGFIKVKLLFFEWFDDSY